MTDSRDMPFASVLDALFGGEDVPVHLVYRLSDLSAADFQLFQREWMEVSEDRRAAIVRHMADVSEENYVVDFTPIFSHLFDDPYPAVRVAALDGIWDSTDPRLIRPVIDLMQKDRDNGVRAAAARALAHYVLLAEWGQVNPDLTAPIVEALLAEYERPLAALEVRRAALEAVSSANHPRIPDLIQDAYDDAPMDLQLSAIFAMGGSADRRWLPILHDEIGSSSPDFRAEAARAAGAIGASDSIDALEALLVDEDLEVAIAAVYALGQIGGDRVNELLLRLSEDPDFEELYDAIDEALEEMESLSGDFDLLSFAEDDDDDDLHDLRAN